MNAADFAQILAELETAPKLTREDRDLLTSYARWCTDRVLELAGPNDNDAEKRRLTALLVRAHDLLVPPGTK